MTPRHQVRQLAIQALYQLDARGDADAEQVEATVREAPASAEIITDALGMAQRAWLMHDEADKLAAELAPDWPTHRQPPVDRAILRLAYYEIAGETETPAAVVINEAIELAKTFSSERSPAFINGVLDKIAKRLRPNEERLSRRETPGKAAAQPLAVKVPPQANDQGPSTNDQGNEQ
ncbi:MAG: transcription antitermination factor NusB [Planctomycetes bacterium]|nr:transcription antitermination factor NusB [Planctomycetota bacterium]